MDVTTQTTRRAPHYRSRTAQLRSQVHFEKVRLDLSEPAYRNILYSVTGQRYARDLNETQLEQVLVVTSDMAPRRRPVEYVSDAEALGVLGL